LAIVIQPYRQEHEPAVQEFNRRLRNPQATPISYFLKTPFRAAAARQQQSSLE